MPILSTVDPPFKGTHELVGAAGTVPAAQDTGISKDAAHPILGDVNKLIAANHQAEFVSHGWIEFHKVTDDASDDGDKFIFAWGPRARVVVDRMMVLKMACLIMDNDEPENWSNHFATAQQAQQDAQQRQNQ
uniref:Uncharacterized protein n=1 Tax=Plectus sambesii TaxID=2011161 RepID=A0A914VWW1_9BILA